MLITTERLGLRRYQPEDFEAFYACYSAPGMKQQAGWTPDADMEKARAEFMERKVACEGALAIILRESGAYVGDIEAAPPHPWLRSQECLQGKLGVSLSFATSETYRGQGLMYEAASALIRALLERMDYVNCGYFAQNMASGRLQEKLGFVPLGTHTFPVDGVETLVLEGVIWAQ